MGNGRRAFQCKLILNALCAIGVFIALLQTDKETIENRLPDFVESNKRRLGYYY